MGDFSRPIYAVADYGSAGKSFASFRKNPLEEQWRCMFETGWRLPAVLRREPSVRRRFHYNRQVSLLWNIRVAVL